MDGAYQIDITQADRLVMRFERDASASYATLTNWDGAAHVHRKDIVALSSSDQSRVSAIRLYTGESTYEQWGYQYDGQGNNTTRTKPGGATYARYSYTTKGRLSTAGTTGMPTATWQYATGALKPTRMVRPDRLNVDYSYDG